jgi:putative transposase
LQVVAYYSHSTTYKVVLHEGLAMWNLDAPPGFQGLRDDLDLNIYMRHLPHWRQDGATYYVTFRLTDSLPQSKLKELVDLRKEWYRQPQPNSKEISEKYSREVMKKVEAWLDQGMGICILKHPAASETVAQAMHHFDGVRYQLASYIIMPNHVHVIVQPKILEDDPLEWIVHSWKRYTARQINEHLDRNGSLWQKESFDRIVRDEEHLYRCIQYIGSNAKKAGLALQACPRWIRPDWKEAGWNFVDE